MRLAVCHACALVVGCWLVIDLPTWVLFVAAFAWGFAVGGAHEQERAK